MNPHVETMLRLGRLRREDAARAQAAALLEKASDFLASARRDVDALPSVALVNAYTAARQAVTALMWSHGLRTGSKTREHEVVAEFARVAVPATRDLDMGELDRLRRRRHDIEYLALTTATPVEASRACSFADRVLVEVRTRIVKAGA